MHEVWARQASSPSIPGACICCCRHCEAGQTAAVQQQSLQGACLHDEAGHRLHRRRPIQLQGMLLRKPTHCGHCEQAIRQEWGQAKARDLWALNTRCF